MSARSDRRWGAAAPLDHGDAQRRLLDAAQECFERYGVVKTTLEDVANAAQVSRATIYRYFDGRDALVLGVIVRRASVFYERLVDVLDASADFGDGIVAGVTYAVRAARADRYIALFFTGDATGLASRAVGTSELVFRQNADALRPFLERAQRGGELRDGVEVDDVADWLLRVVLMLLLVGPAEYEEGLERLLVLRFVVPALTRGR